MSFNKELAFESALINLLFEKGWKRTSSKIRRKRNCFRIGQIFCLRIIAV